MDTALALAARAAAPASSPELTGLAGWVVSVVEALGPAGVGLLVALENLFPPIPSEVVLPVAGYVASQGDMHVGWAVVGATVGAVAGAWVLYGLGVWLGRERLRRWLERIPLMEVEDLDRAESWFVRHGGAAVLVGRCVPVVRSLVSVPAGLERMPQVRFLVYTALGSAVWNSALVVSGYVLGEQWEDVGHYSDYINYAVYAAIVVIVVRFVWTRLRRRRLAARG
ncbi:DedA family protein [Cellulomonas sp. ES6]|uniref:DedA family protein n=1 Tax=Cellulomonas sp. ES6 TaxID=3039384 RepID=UPI0024B6AB7B|nr:DedA family protein [Cellulomonas sp. ES6]WHP16725.1 DedA family protein [Cellulomonas sp. ES6]